MSKPKHRRTYRTVIWDWNGTLLNAGHQSRSRLEACGVPVLDNLHALRSWLIGKR